MLLIQLIEISHTNKQNKSVKKLILGKPTLCKFTNIHYVFNTLI